MAEGNKGKLPPRATLIRWGSFLVLGLPVVILEDRADTPSRVVAAVLIVPWIGAWLWPSAQAKGWRTAVVDWVLAALIIGALVFSAVAIGSGSGRSQLLGWIGFTAVLLTLGLGMLYPFLFPSRFESEEDPPYSTDNR